MKLVRITPEEFQKLKKGDIIHIKCGETFYKGIVCAKPFYNSDSDAPCWEVETNNGFCDICSIYMPNRKPRFSDPFISEPEKMLDFLYLSKDEFLESYSYLTEEEYNATVDAVLKLIYPND